ncbi:uncharacterized protein LOC143446090 isoform X1 [Clavelina lepadiformis]|uniref:uncharacterized protein LOC143446090 isoform X1 n=1 Tax=Clavelina lepadiformis TaxID=159417 RepID=UPI004042DED7
MKVILAGYSKTGTKTMVVALTELGYNVYDYMDHFWYHGDKWAKILSPSGGSIEDFKEMYHSVDAVTDAPPYKFWEEILQAYPDAKVILTSRDEDSWYESACKQTKALSSHLIYQLMQVLSPTGWRLFKHHRRVIMALVGIEVRHPFDFSHADNRMVLTKAYRHHTQYCKQNCPPDKLLVYDVRQGWEPLCEFLGKEIPDKPFPRENIGGNVSDKLMATHPAFIRIQREAATTSVLLCLTLCLVTYKYHKFHPGKLLLDKLSSLFQRWFC